MLSAASYFHSTFKDEVWLWRGQADGGYGLEASMHTRVLDSKLPHTQQTVERGTEHLLSTARAAAVDSAEAMKLPDLALLASLQHYGAATPLLDVSTDPLIGLWMAAFASPQEPEGKDDRSGRLFAILRPPRSRWLSPLDARPYSLRSAQDTRCQIGLSAEDASGGGDGHSDLDEYGSAPTIDTSRTVSSWASKCYLWYRAPDITERLRIQRASFIISDLQVHDRSCTSLTVDLGPKTNKKNFVERRWESRALRSAPKRQSEVFSILIRGSVKRELRKLLIDRSGLSTESVYPIPWHRPYIEQFAEAYGRTRPLEHDIS